MKKMSWVIYCVYIICYLGLKYFIRTGLCWGHKATVESWCYSIHAALQEHYCSTVEFTFLQSIFKDNVDDIAPLTHAVHPLIM